MGLLLGFAMFMSFAAALLILALLRRIAGGLRLVDRPDQRKRHHGNIPLTGGIGIFGGVLAGWIWLLPPSPPMLGVMAGATAMMVLGAVDDAFTISARLRLLIQATLVLVFILLSGICLRHFGDILFSGNITFASLGIPVTILAVCAGMNAFNMVDGIDGLAGSMALIALFSMTWLFWGKAPEQAGLCLIFSAAVCAFLLFNLSLMGPQKKVFLGDAGTMLLGFVIAFFLISGTQGEEARFRPITAVWLIGLPIMDMVGVMLRRLVRGQSPMEGDRNHLHHILMDAGLSPRKTLIFMTGMGGLLALAGLVGEAWGVHEGVMSGGFIFFFGLYGFWVARYTAKHPETDPELFILGEERDSEV